MRLSNNKHATRSWSEREIAVAAAAWQELVVDRYGDDPADIPRGVRAGVLAQIASRIGRPISVVENRFTMAGPSFTSSRRSLGGETGGMRVPAERVAERAQRQAAGYVRSLTAEIFGDPPPGYSALDRRRA